MKAKELADTYGDKILSKDIDAVLAGIGALIKDLFKEGNELIERRKIREVNDSFFSAWDEISAKWKAVCRHLSSRGASPVNPDGFRLILLSEVGVDLKKRTVDETHEIFQGFNIQRQVTEEMDGFLQNDV